MSLNEINPANSLKTGVDSFTGLPGSISDINRDLFGQSLSKAPNSVLGGIPMNAFLESDDDRTLSFTQTKARSDASSVYGNESEIFPIDRAAQQVGNALMDNAITAPLPSGEMVDRTGQYDELLNPNPSNLSATVRSGDTLWEIAQKELGTGSRWRELQKADGKGFTEKEAYKLPIGSEVYIPKTESPQPSSSNSLDSVSSQPSKEVHVVKSGDTLWDIAEAKLGDGNRWKELQKADGKGFTEEEAYQLPIGTEVYLPKAASDSERLIEYTTRSGDTLQSIAEKLLKNGDRWTELRTADNKPFTAEEAKQFKPGTPVYLTESSVPKELRDILLVATSESTQANGSATIPDKLKDIAIGIGIGDTIVRRRLKRDIVNQVRGSETALRKLEQLQQQLPSVFDKKAIALTESGKLTYSGWTPGKLTQKELSDLETIAKEKGLKVVHPDPNLSREMAKGDTIKYEARPEGARDHRTPGKAQYSHAEKQGFSLPGRNRAIAVSRPVCGDKGKCGEFIRRLADKQKKPHVLAAAADSEKPAKIHVARPGDNVDEREPGNGEKRKELKEYAKNTARETFTEQRGLSKPIAQTLDNPVVKKAVKAFKPLGAVADGYELYNAYDPDKSIGDNLKDKDFQETAGNVAGGWGGALGGAAAGAAIGSAVPIVGTVAGGIIGGIVGGFAGGSLGTGLRKLFG
jgi:nucleoid-associated protein YgaU